MSKVVHKNKKQEALTVSTQILSEVLDCTNCNGVAFQINGIAATAGSAKLQHSLDGSNYADITGATVTLGASAAFIINVPSLYAGFVRASVTLSAGPGNYDYFFLAKEN